MEMKSAIRQRTPKDSTAGYRHATSTTAMICKSCNHPFASISAEGALSPSTLHPQACAACEPFLGLYNTLRATEQEHTALLDRGSKHRGRILAHEQFRKARVAFENFLVSIEAPNDAVNNVAEADFANGTEAAPFESAQQTAESTIQGDGQNNRHHASPPVAHATSSADSHAIKRKCSRDTHALYLERKRIKFCENIEDRTEYRGTLEYYRGAKEYVPGRYAVMKGSEYEDTSGSTLSFAKFTGQKKVGSKFIDIVPKEEAQGGGDQTFMLEKTAAGSSETVYNSTHRSDTPEKDESRMNGRNPRVSRRAALSIPAVPPTLPSTSTQYDGQGCLHESPGVSTDTTTLVIALKDPKICNNDVLTEGDRSVSVSEDRVDPQQRRCQQ